MSAEHHLETLRLLHEALPEWRTDLDRIFEEREPWLPRRDVAGGESERERLREIIALLRDHVPVGVLRVLAFKYPELE